MKTDLPKPILKMDIIFKYPDGKIIKVQPEKDKK